jgi:hypothetical protein
MIRFRLVLTIIPAILSMVPLANSAGEHGFALSLAESSARTGSAKGMPVWLEGVRGGVEPRWLLIGTSQGTSDAIRQAAEASLRNASFAVDDDRANLRLDIELKERGQIDSLIAPSMTTTVVVNYRMMHDGLTKELVLKTAGSTSFSDGLVMTERTRIALERALKENFKQFFDFLLLEFKH